MPLFESGLERRVGHDVRLVLASIYTLGYFGILVLTFYKEPPVNNEDSIKLLLGLLSAIQVTIIQYYFGSSRDTAVATQTTATAVDKMIDSTKGPNGSST